MEIIALLRTKLEEAMYLFRSLLQAACYSHGFCQRYYIMMCLRPTDSWCQLLSWRFVISIDLLQISDQRKCQLHTSMWKQVYLPYLSCSCLQIHAHSHVPGIFSVQGTFGEILDTLKLNPHCFFLGSKDKAKYLQSLHTLRHCFSNDFSLYTRLQYLI